MYIILSSTTSQHDLFLCFDREIIDRSRKCIVFKTIHVRVLVKILLKDVFYFAERLDVTFVSGYKLTSEKSNYIVLSRNVARGIGEFEVKIINGMFFIILQVFRKKFY